MGTLFIIGTPIGNLEDLSPRAARLLGQVVLVAAEDTRVTRRLLNHLGIRVPTLSYHQHNWRTRLPQVIKSLADGDVALVCDAGMPVVSDPGSELVSQAASAGFSVEVVPGPSALTAALSVSGFSGDAFTFLGFLPPRRKDRRQRLKAVAQLPMTLVLFEAPHRLKALLQDVLEELGDRQVALCRELTKLYEEVFRGNVSQALEHSQAPRGEYVVVIQGASEPEVSDEASTEVLEQAAAQLAELRSNRTRAKDAVAQVSLGLGLPKNVVYRMWVDLGRSNV
ncbi:MAG: 16S rRNA (cytidine(1402)-2'-O)-methyltransferase [SAR202 cluster bacterium Io17-Chloro-G4]|nr:MAG: 16S rRNA (cytidine(1402)-2'-O)-methyltransferase [SAR202 cluster bacterium Io17-Chloro-G4]